MHRPKNELENLIKKVRSDNDLSVVIDGKEITPEGIEEFLNDIVTGKIDNKYNAKQKFLKNTQGDEDLLRSIKYRQGGKAWRLVDLIDNVKYIGFGSTLSFSDKQSKITDDETNMPELESEESAAQRGQGLKILTPQQMLTRLPISLAQLKSGNNSQKRKN